MEVLLLGIYSFFVWLIFFKFKWLPWTTTAQITVAIIPIVGIAVLILSLNVVAPSSSDVRVFKYTIPIVSQVRGRVIDVPVEEGNRIVHKGDVIAHIDPRPFQVQLAQAEGQAAKDEAAIRDAKIDLQRYQALIARDAIPQQQVDAQVATVDQLAGALKSDQSQIASAQLNLTYCRITAPITGRVGLRLVDAGNIVHAADQTGLIVITQVEPIAVVFTIPEDNLPMVLEQVRKGRRLNVEVFNRDLNTRLATGSLLTVDNEIDPATGTVKLKATFANADGGLFPNQFVNARLLVDTIHSVLIVPTAAIQRSPQSTFVYAVNPADMETELHTYAKKLLNEGRVKEAWQVLLHDLYLSKKKPPQRKFNGAQQIAYTSVIIMGLGSLLTGLAIYKPIQFAFFEKILGGYEAARMEHFILTIGYVLFFVIHIIQVIRAGWNNFRAIVAGWEVVEEKT